MTDISPLTANQDIAPDSSLARAFRLPHYIQADEELAALFNEIVGRFLREASGLPMNTHQQLMIERLASFYVQIKWREENSTFTPNQQKEFNNYYLALAQEFNRTLIASQDAIRDALLDDIFKMAKEAVDTIADGEDRRNVRRMLSEGFAGLGL